MSAKRRITLEKFRKPQRKKGGDEALSSLLVVLPQPTLGAGDRRFNPRAPTNSCLFPSLTDQCFLGTAPVSFSEAGGRFLQAIGFPQLRRTGHVRTVIGGQEQNDVRQVEESLVHRVSSSAVRAGVRSQQVK